VVDVMRGARNQRQLRTLLSEAESLLAQFSGRASSGMVAGTSTCARTALETSTIAATLGRTAHTSRAFSSLVARGLQIGRTGGIPTATTHMPASVVLRRTEAALFRRLFSSEPPPKRGWEKFYPKDKSRRPAAQAKQPKGTDV
jgi:hypothetical protein